jgi:SOS response regulatory protein OraA/RecX
VHLDLVIKHKLSKHSELDEFKYEALLSDLRIFSAKRYTYGYCSRARRTERQVIIVLKKKGLTPQEMKEVLNFLKEFQLLDDEKYIHAAMDYYQTRKHYGVPRIRLELIKEGINKKLIENTLAEYEDETENEVVLAKRLISKRKSKIQSKTDINKLRLYIYKVMNDAGITRNTAEIILKEILAERKKSE